MNNVKNGELWSARGLRHKALCLDVCLLPKGAGPSQLGGNSLVCHFGGSAVVVGGDPTIRGGRGSDPTITIWYGPPSDELLSFDLKSGWSQRAISPTWPVNVNAMT